MTSSDDIRNQFASFLEELATGYHEPDRWREVVVEHYADELTESVRRQLVRISIAPENQTSFPFGQAEQLRDWANQLRRGDSSLLEQEHRMRRDL